MRIEKNKSGGVVVIMPLEDLLELLRLDQGLYRLSSGSYIWLYNNGLLPHGAKAVATPVDFLQELPTLCDESSHKLTAHLTL